MRGDDRCPVSAAQVVLACLVLTLGSASGRGTAAEPESATPEGGPGPVEIRDDWLLAQGRLGLPATSPDPLPVGQLRLGLDFGVGNDFGWDQSKKGEEPEDRRFLVDGEHGQLTLSARRGLAPRLDAELRLGVVWRNGGFMDGLIDAWHGWLGPAGVRDNGRPFFFTDLLRVEGRDGQGGPVVWEGRAGAGLSNAELSFRYGLSRGAGWRTALVGRVLLPTGTGSFGAGGWDVAAQLVAGRQLSASVDLYLDLGVTRFGTRENRGIAYANGQLSGHAALTWQLSPRWMLEAQLRAASRLVEELARYPGIQSYLDLSASRRFGRWRLLAGFSENIKHQQATVDFAIHIGLTAVY
jgi:hypothetical protein